MYFLYILVILVITSIEINSYPRQIGYYSKGHVSDENNKDIDNGTFNINQINFKNEEGIQGADSLKDLEKEKAQDEKTLNEVGSGEISKKFLKKDEIDSNWNIDNKKYEEIGNHLNSIFNKLNKNSSALQVNFFTGSIAKLAMGHFIDKN